MTISPDSPLDLRDALSRFSSCDVADALDQLGLRDQTALGLRRLWDDCPRVAGRVMTLKLGPGYDGSTVMGTLEAIESCQPGDVLLLDNGGLLDRNTFGSVAAFSAARYGISGAIIDGVSRDIDDLRAQAFPVYARGVTTTTVRGRTGLAGYGVPVQCAGVQVEAGDYVVADGSGVIIVPAAAVRDVINIAPRFQELERELRRRMIAGGKPTAAHAELQYEQVAEPPA